MENVIIGYRRGTSKKGNAYCMVHVASNWSASDTDAAGQNVSQLFMPNDQINLLTPADIGKKLKINYTFLGNRPVIDSVEILGK